MKKIFEHLLLFLVRLRLRVSTRNLYAVPLMVLLLGILLTGCANQISPSNQTGLKSISVVMDNNYPPFTFLDANGNMQGILVDRWKLWEKKTGVTVNITGMVWSDALTNMQAGEFDVIDTIFKNDSRAQIYDFSAPYQTIDVPIYFNNDISGIVDANSLKGFPVAVKKNDAVIDYLLNNGIDNLVEYNSYESIIKAAVAHDVIVFAMDKPPADYYLNKYSLQNKFNSTVPLYSGQFHRAVLKGNTPLLTIVENGFAQISKSEYAAIDRKWYGSPAINDKYFTYAGVVAAVALIVLAFLIVWNRSLQANVKRKTKTIQESQQKYQQIFETAGIGIFTSDENGLFLSGNPAILQILGYTIEEYTHLSITNISFPDDTKIHNDLFKELWEGKRDSFTLETRNIHKDGNYVWGRVTSSMVRDAEGTPLFSIGMFEEVSERKVSEKIQEIIYKISQATNSSSSLDELYILIHNILSDLIPVENFFIALYDPKDNLFHFPFSRDQYEDSVEPISPGRSLTGYVFRMGKPLLATHDVFLQLLDQGEVELIGTMPFDWLGVPLIVNEQVIGVMATQSYSQDIHFSQKESDLLAFVSIQIAQAIERKKAEEALSKSENEMRALFSAMTDIIMVLDYQGRYLKIVGTNSSLLYRPPNELIGKTLHEVLEKKEADLFLQYISSVLSTHQKVSFEYSLPIGDKIVWFNAVLSPLTKETVIWVARNITDRKQAEEAQLISEKRYHSLFEDSPISLWEEDFSEVKRYLDDLKQKGVTDFKAYFEAHPREVTECISRIKVKDVNRAALKLVHAQTKDQLIGNIHQILGRNAQKDFIEEFVNIAAGLIEFDWEGFNTTLDGNTINVNMRWSVLSGYEESIARVLVSVTDITSRNQAEAALLASEASYRNLVANLGEGIAIVDDKEFFTFANPSAHEIFGVEPGSLIGRNLNDFLAPASREITQMQTTKRKAGEYSVYEIEIDRPNGEHRIILVSGRPQVNDEGKFIGTFGIFHDITLRKITEEKLNFRSRFEELLTQISTRFINLSSGEIENEINLALKLIGEFEDVDRSYVFLINEIDNTISNTHEWCNTGVSSQLTSIQNLPLSALPWLLSRIVDQPIIVNRVATLPAEALLEKKIFESQDIQSLAIFPMQANQKLMGFVGFDAVRAERDWDEESTAMMQQFANILTNALERSRLMFELEERAIRDELTGTLNRRGFIEFATLELNRSLRFKRSVGLIFFDLDHFKQINDTFGHPAGDLIIQETIKCSLANIREIDLLGRWGGDEFVVLLPESDLESTKLVSERLRKNIEEHTYSIMGNPIQVTVSVGVTISNNNSVTLADLFQQADSALYTAKQSGRNCVSCFK
ncbi:MAG: PAS domain S-box protein [Anaerolineaceae bacterium]